MSLVAKVFIVLNLLVSVAFLIFAMNIWTAPTKWQAMYEKEKIQSVENLARAQKPVVELWKDLVMEKQQVVKETTAREKMKKDMEAARDRELQTSVQLAKEQNDRSKVQAEKEESDRELKRVYEDLTKLKGVVIKQQLAVATERENAQRARNLASEMEAELNVTRQTLAAVNRDKLQTETDLARQNHRMEALLKAGVDIAALIGEDMEVTQTPVDAQVLAVRGELGLVMLSAGSQQGVKPGYRLVISRGGEYIAKVQVDRVYPDMCSAKVLKGMLKPGAAIQIHDEAKSQ